MLNWLTLFRQPAEGVSPGQAAWARLFFLAALCGVVSYSLALIYFFPWFEEENYGPFLAAAQRLLFSVAVIVACHRVLRGKRFGVTLLTYLLIVALAVAAEWATWELRPHFRLPKLDDDSHAILRLLGFFLELPRITGVFAFLLAFALVARNLLSTRVSEDETRTSLFSGANGWSRPRMFQILTMALVLALFWDALTLASVESLFSLSLSSWPGERADDSFLIVLGNVISLLFAHAADGVLMAPTIFYEAGFGVAAMLIVVWIASRLSVSESGIGLHLGQCVKPIFQLRWRGIYRCDALSHDGVLDTAVLRWRLFRILPLTVAVHAKHWVGGLATVERVIAMARSHEVRVDSWQSSRKVKRIAFGFLVVGVASLPINAWATEYYWHKYVRDEIGFTEFHLLLNIIPVSVLMVIGATCIGLALGLMSAHHRASPRPILLLYFLLACDMIAVQRLMWLLWPAIYSIFLANRGIEPAPSLPNMQHWYAGIALAGFVHVIGGFSYLAGIIFGCRKSRSSD